MPLRLATRGIAYITAAMGKAAPPSYPCYLHILVEGDKLPFTPDDGVVRTVHYCCLLGEFTDSQYCGLNDWLGQSLKTDRFVVDLTSDYDNGHGFPVRSSTRIEFNFARITEQTSDELKHVIASLHDDFQHALAADRERVLKDDHSPYRVLYEVRRKADYFRGCVTDDAAPCRTPVTADNAKLSNGSNHSPVSTAVTPPSRPKRGRPKSLRTDWVMEQHDAGLEPAEIMDKWNALSELEREQIDKSNPDTYKNKGRNKDGRPKIVESIRQMIKRERRRRRQLKTGH